MDRQRIRRSGRGRAHLASSRRREIIGNGVTRGWPRATCCRLLLGFLLAVVGTSLFAADTGTEFGQFTCDAGLSHPSVSSILQDKQGVLWFGTEDGLNRYDGNSFTVFRHKPNDPNSLSDSVIYWAQEDTKGDLWIGTGKGVDRMERGDGKGGPLRFIHYVHDENNPRSIGTDGVGSCVSDKNGRLWFGAAAQLERYDPRTDSFAHYSLGNPYVKRRGPPYDDMYQVVLRRDSAGDLWVGYPETRLDGVRLEKYAVGIDESSSLTLVARYRPDPNDLESLTDGVINDVLEDSSGVLWITAWGGGLCRLDTHTGKVRRYLHDPHDPTSLPDNNLLGLCFDKRGHLWAYGDQGIAQMLPPSGSGAFPSFAYYRHIPTNPRSLCDDSVRSMFCDRSGVLWIGTVRGLSNLPLKEDFICYAHKEGMDQSLPPDPVTAMLEDHAGRLWVGSRAVDGTPSSGGLTLIMPAKDNGPPRYTTFRQSVSDPRSLSHSYIATLFEDSKNRIWVGTDGGGLNELDWDGENPGSVTFRAWRHSPDDAQSLSDDRVLSILEDREGEIWLGTWGGGLSHFDVARGRFTNYQQDPGKDCFSSPDYIRKVIEDRRGDLWTGTGYRGLCKFNKTTKQWTSYTHNPDEPTSLGDNRIYSLYEDPNGFIWIATWHGLGKYDAAKNTFHHYSVQAGFPYEKVFGVLGDFQVKDEARLWLSTAGALVRFDPVSEFFQSFERQNCPQVQKYMEGSYFQSRTGDMFFGGEGGMIRFTPSKHRGVADVPIIISDLKILNRSVRIGKRQDGRVLLKRDISETREIVLSPKDYDFALELAVLDYMDPARNRYRYKLEGFDENWVQGGPKERVAHYTNLAPGNYTFRAQGANSDGAWNRKGVTLTIRVLPPFWVTWWFRVGATLSVVLVLGGGYSARVYRIKSRNRELVTTNRALNEQIQERKRAESHLRESEGKLATTLDAIHEGVITTDEMGRIVRMNTAAEHLTGWRDGSAQGKDQSEVVQLLNAETKEPMDSPFQIVMSHASAGATPVGISPPHDRILVSRDGTEKRVSWSAAPIRSDKDEVTGVVLVLHDKTDKYQLEEQLLHARKMESLGQLAGGIAHDFNNLLGPVMGYAEMVSLMADEQPEVKEYARIILKSAERAAGLTQQLLSFSRKAKVVSGGVNVHKVLEDTIEMLRHTIDRRIEIRTDLRAEKALVTGDASQLQNAFLNLALNARDAMPDGGTLLFSTRTVYLDRRFLMNQPEEREPGNYLEISVSDTGRGMDRKTQERIFEPFFTTKERSKGTGLGLTSVYGAVQQHAGIIHVRSELGRGTTIRMHLPAQGSPSDDKSEPSLLPGSHATILVIEDEEEIRKMVQMILVDLGYAVFLAEDGVEGEEVYRARKDEIDLVLLDFIMPRKGGREVLASLREMNPDVLVLIVSGHSFGVDESTMVEEGAAGFLQKPFRIGALSEKIAEVLARKNAT
jgi:PAS domain S-box-containing protein